MFLISDALNKYFSLRLKNKTFRQNSYKAALANKLRLGKLNLILLRNLNQIMSDNIKYHDEFRELLSGSDFQQAFWESDLGYLWYLGNLHNQNLYFKNAVNEIKKQKHVSVLDVGCGWGEFSVIAAGVAGVKKSIGIDISEKIIQQAKNLNAKSVALFEHKNVLDVKEKFDFITLFGSTDYIPPEVINKVLEKVIQLANKQIVIVNSLRKMSFNQALDLTESIEIKRYDVGYVHPLKKNLEQLQLKYEFNYACEKAGQDSLMISILK